MAVGGVAVTWITRREAGQSPYNVPVSSFVHDIHTVYVYRAYPPKSAFQAHFWVLDLSRKTLALSNPPFLNDIKGSLLTSLKLTAEDNSFFYFSIQIPFNRMILYPKEKLCTNLETCLLKLLIRTRLRMGLTSSSTCANQV